MEIDYQEEISKLRHAMCEDIMYLCSKEIALTNPFKIILFDRDMNPLTFTVNKVIYLSNGDFLRIGVIDSNGKHQSQACGFDDLPIEKLYELVTEIKKSKRL